MYTKKNIFLGIFIIIILSGLIVSCSSDKLKVEGQYLFTMPLGTLPGEFKHWDKDINTKINTYLEIQDGIFYIANGSRVLKLSSNGYLLDYISNDLLLKSSDKNSINLFGEDIPFYYFPLEKIDDISVDSKGKLLIANSNNSNQRRSRFFSDDRDIINSELLVYDNSNIYLQIQEDGDGKKFGATIGVYAQANDNIILVTKNELSFIVYVINKDGRVLKKIIFPMTQYPSYIPDAIDASVNDEYFGVIEKILPSYKLNYLYVQYVYYKKEFDNYSGSEIEIPIVSSRVYRVRINTASFDNYIELPQSLFPEDIQLAQVLSNEEFLFIKYFDIHKEDVERQYSFSPQVKIFGGMNGSDNKKARMKKAYELTFPDVEFFDFQLAFDRVGNIGGYILLKDRVEVYWWAKK